MTKGPLKKKKAGTERFLKEASKIDVVKTIPRWYNEETQRAQNDEAGESGSDLAAGVGRPCF